MKITCISDLHGHFPELDGGDLLLIAGDITARDTIPEWVKFYDWLAKQEYKKKVYIGGNHDMFLAQCCSSTEAKDILPEYEGPDERIEYLCDSGTEFEGFKIWGSPWVKSFPNMNPKCKAFTVDSEEELAEKFALIPDDIDILVTHCPAFGTLDEFPSGYNARYGSCALRHELARIRPNLHVFGHIHEGYGKCYPTYINASHVNERYEPVNKPITINYAESPNGSN